MSLLIYVNFPQYYWTGNNILSYCILLYYIVFVRIVWACVLACLNITNIDSLIDWLKIKQLETVAVDSVHCLPQSKTWRCKVAVKLYFIAKVRVN